MTSRQTRFVDTTEISFEIMMDDAYSKYAKNFGFMYSLKDSPEEREATFNAERSNNEYLNKTCQEVERKKPGIAADVFKFVKAIYATEYPPNLPFYKYFNAQTSNIKTFFDWEEFNMKGMWLLLQQAFIDTKPLQVSKHVYRGVRVPFAAEVGQIVAFKHFTSTSSDMNIAKDFLGKSGNRTTMFDIEIDVGLEIKNIFGRDEKEILLMPYDAYEVLSVEKEGDLKIISLKQLQSSIF